MVIITIIITIMTVIIIITIKITITILPLFLLLLIYNACMQVLTFMEEFCPIRMELIIVLLALRISISLINSKLFSFTILQWWKKI